MNFKPLLKDIPTSQYRLEAEARAWNKVSPNTIGVVDEIQTVRVDHNQKTYSIQTLTDMSAPEARTRLDQVKADLFERAKDKTPGHNPTKMEWFEDDQGRLNIIHGLYSFLNGRFKHEAYRSPYEARDLSQAFEGLYETLAVRMARMHPELDRHVRREAGRAIQQFLNANDFPSSGSTQCQVIRNPNGADPAIQESTFLRSRNEPQTEAEIDTMLGERQYNRIA